MAWPTKADVQARTGITIASGAGVDETTYGVNVTNLLTEARAYVASACNRDPEYGFDESAITAELHDYERGALIYVKHPPIVSVSALELSDSALSEADEDFYVYTNYIQLAEGREYDLVSRGPRCIYPQAIDLDYTGGYSDADGTHVAIPSALKTGVLRVACIALMQIHEEWREMKGAKKVTIGQYAATFEHNKEVQAIVQELKRGRWAIQGW